MPAISVIIPTYNHEQFIEQTLESVFAQSFTDYEIIIVNDGSTDGTNSRIKPYLGKDFITYCEKPNGGQASARNFGLAMAKGEYIAFLDDDDLWPSDKLEWQYQEIKNSDLAAVGGSCNYIVDGKKQESFKHDKDTFLIHADFFHGNPFVSPGQVLIRADILRKIGGFDPEIWGADDLDLWMRLSLEGKILKSSRNALWYRKHEHNASKNRIRMLENSKKVLRKNAVSFEKSDQKKHLRNGYRWLYNYAGRELILDSKRLLKSFRFITFFKNMVPFTKTFFPHALLDIELTRAIGNDWIPNRIQERLQARQKHKSN